MEMTLAILMALGIFVGIPLLVGLFIAGIYVRSDRRLLRKERSLQEAAGEVKEAAGLQEKTETTVRQEVG